MQPKVSICIPAYGAEPFFRRTLASALAQDFASLEVIVTDDSPTDEVERVVIQAGDARVRYQRNAKRLGSPANWNEGLKLVRAPLVKMMHHDDWFTDERSLQRLVALADANPHASFFFAGAWVCDAQGQRKHRHVPPPEKVEQLRRDPAALFLANFIGSPSETLWRHDPEARFDERLKWLVDVDFYMRWLIDKPALAQTDEPLMSNTWGAEHQVTNDCCDNRDLLLLEWTLVYTKLAARGLMRRPHTRHMRDLYRRYEVTSPAQLRQVGVQDPLPGGVRRILWWNRLKSRFYGSLAGA